MSTQKQLTIDIVSDVVCPWCYIGYQRLEQAMKSYQGKVQFTIRWHPFELNPDMSADGQLLSEHLEEKYQMTPEQSAENRARIVELGEALNIRFQFTPLSRIYNTFRAHQLLHWSALYGRQTDLKLALFEAYFTEQENVYALEVLLSAVERAGLDAEEAEQVLKNDKFSGVIREEEQVWIEQGVRAVPAFIFNEKYLVSGAQNTESLIQVIDNLLSESAE
ncbi:DsbA family oxidoreductase [Photobacterium sp. 1_MG-2023]|uniref:DsbA family oxidoreductase n=1 Tax=Photobacterium sp. 1_MG-2023 TaxID=3062646 RepID=UPI0026E256CD|nr:DsbA family oxidoreductase [Photobacterium sp. 1_MG-2023]MDO6706918.1 DsbA family oxidoreductase [Photobacterium sp. 1_MG-2023]